MFSKMKLMKRRNPAAPTISQSDNENGGVNWIISIRGAIDSPEHYAIACDVLINATEKDTVLIVLNTPGGYVTTGLAIINAMNHCKAPVTTRAVGMVASCGALIWAAGHRMEVCKFTRIMFHASSGGFMGKTRDQRDKAEAIEDVMRVAMHTAVDKKILTEQQFEDAFETKQDFYLNINDLKASGVVYEIAA